MDFRVKSRQSGQFDRDGIALVEEATHVLRSASLQILATYYVGTIPFVIGFLFFWTDMSSSPFAREHAAGSALWMAVLFFWMKFWQASFSAKLRALHANEPLPAWTLQQGLRVLMTQSLVHSLGLFMLPMALLLLGPFAWVYAFFQSATALADPGAAGSRTLFRRAWGQAARAPWPHHVALGILFVFGLVVFINWIVIFFWTPSLLKTLLGIDTPFSRNPLAMFNSTLFSVVLCVTYLCVDPLIKTFYVLRCFYGESRNSGDDIKATLRQLGAEHPRVAVLVLVCALVLPGTTAAAVQPTLQVVESPAAEINPAELDRHISEVIQQPRYAWRMPRTAAETADKNLITRFLEATGRFVRRVFQTIWQWIEDLIRWIFQTDQPSGNRSIVGALSRSLPFILLILTICVVIALLFRLRNRKKQQSPVQAVSVARETPDIRDENVSADQLPEDGWTRLARELLERGEYRLSMRAYYLSSLAHLAHRNLIGIARFKSNREYETELRRHEHAAPDVVPVFGENLSLFERIWYGTHAVDGELVRQFAANVDRIRSAA